MKKVTLSCDYPQCEAPPVARAYLKVLTRYGKSGARLSPARQESLGSADLCQEHFGALSKATEGGRRT